MSSENHWTEDRIIEARSHHPLVTDAASSRMAEALKSQLGEQQLSSMDLTSLASALIADMASAPMKTDSKQ